MTTSSITSELAGPVPAVMRRMRVLLVDDSTATRELRAEAMRKLGMDVDCACDISEARCWWRADLYNLVLFDMQRDVRYLDGFCEDIRMATPRQQLAFLVGKPKYLSHAPGPATLAGDAHEPVAAGNRRTSGAVPAPALPWGILEASRRISAVRSASVARTTAMRNRPMPPRDLEGKASRHAEVMSQLASELRKEELL